ncbi:PKD domain-containing protein [Flavobacterium sp. MAH-1]|uniref:PKD domain-containing protein n=1 Tax=Flavobacterium agri TaxID=2743471 RepID=A0A7Y8Y5B9_9FLAO|nr:PKD domain-containing protein [Flavobacterium agri]NUY81546.1 PKD domain-containing protein [Flavobacterium agri]NYA71570.1 PKD domain-containing protein [Flavobacterium agri]
MKKILNLVLLFYGCLAFSQTEPCGTDVFAKTIAKEFPEAQARFDATDQQIQEYIQQGRGRKSTQANITIPVIVYVVHNGVPEGTGTNISDNQVQSQISALNDHFSLSGITFCLATRRGVNSTSIPMPSGATQTIPGIIHVNNATSSNPMLTQASLDALISATASSNLMPSRYMRIYVVQSIDGASSGILGFAPFPNSPLFDGVLMRYDAFGDAATCGGCNLLASNNQGKVLTHEVGHYLSLYHTFQGGCSGVNDGTMDSNGVLLCNKNGDKVCDTPQGAMIFGCPVSVTVCPNDVAQDIHNFMQYTNDACRTQFSAGQQERMLAALAVPRVMLGSTDNLIYTGICGYQNLISATYTPSTYQTCQNSAVTFTPLLISNPNTTYLWNFGDGTTSSASTAVSHTFASSANSPYTVTLTLTSGGSSAVYSSQIYVSPCNTPIPGGLANWYLSSANGLAFGSGVPVVDPVFPSANKTYSSSSVANTSSGSVLFYTNGVKVWRANHSLVNASSGSYVAMKGHSGGQNAVVAVPIPNTTDYYIFTKGSNITTVPGEAANPLDGLRYTRINVSGTTLTMPVANMNVPVTPLSGMSGYLLGNNNAMYGGQAVCASQKCGGYWIFTTLRKSSTELALVVFSLTSAGLTYSSSITTPVTQPNFNNNETIKVSPDGNRLVYQNNNYSPLVLYDFDKFTGVLSNPKILFAAPPQYVTQTFAFSPDSKLLYTADLFKDLYQFNLNSPDPGATKRIVAHSVASRGMKLGPDGKIYFSDPLKADLFSFSVIHNPNNLVTEANPNACAYSPQGPQFPNTVFGSGSLYTAMPNIVEPMGLNSISPVVNGCSSYKFFPNVAQGSCYTSFIWNFGDPSSGAANTSTANTPTHNFTAPGTYTITLNSSTNVFIAQTTVTITPMAMPVIDGSATACTTIDNHTYNSVNLLDGQTAQWSITGGGGTIIGQSNQSAVEIAWTSLPGTISLTVTNSAGCTSTVTKQIGQLCCPCFDDITYGVYPMEFGSALSFEIYLDNEVDCDLMEGGTVIWNYGDGTPPTNVTSHQFPATATYTVTATVTLNGCTTTISFPVLAGGPGSGPGGPGGGTGNSKTNTHLQHPKPIARPIVKPNPSHGLFNIHVEKFSGKFNLQVFDLNGRLVFEKDEENFETEKTIDLSHLQSGVYVLSASGQNMTFAQKIIKN